MSNQNVSSARSDDGHQINRVRSRENELEDNRVQRHRSTNEDQTRFSVTAELSDGGPLRQRPDEQPISEQPDDEDHASSPAGSIGDRHDIMSENIESTFHKFNKFNKGKLLLVKCLE